MLQLKNERGIALVTALCFTLICLGIIMMLLYTILQGTKTTSASKRYATVLEASYGTVDLLQKDLIPQLINMPTSGYDALAAQFTSISMDIPGANRSCFAEKLSKASWDTTLCNAATQTAKATLSPDMTFNLKATNDTTGYRIYTKIISTRCAATASDPCSNSDAGSEGVPGLFKPGGTTATTTPPAPSLPAIYRIEVSGERANNPREKAELTVLYAY
jgi:hypothetical protein